MSELIVNIPDFSKGLIPAIIQDFDTGKILMQGYMNAEALKKTMAEKKVTFYSRSKNRLWTKGEESGHYLNYIDHAVDCDADSLLIQVRPIGSTCHTGADTCWNQENKRKVMFLNRLAEVIRQRKDEDESSSSYTKSLFKKGINKIAQKVGEEAVELVIEAKDDNKDLFLGEAADLLFHYMVLLEAKNYELDEVIEILIQRHEK